MTNSSQQEENPLDVKYSKNIPSLIHELNCTISISTYHIGRLILLCAPSGQKIVQVPTQFQKPMGVAIQGSKMAITTAKETIVLVNSPGHAHSYPPKPNRYDALYLPRSVYFSGKTDNHDLEFTKHGLMAVNTGFSCLSLIDNEYSFKPYWQPPFISDRMPEDRCHLNGMAVADEEPVYATALSQTDHKNGWRQSNINEGVLMHIPSSQILRDDLPIPHSPRIINGQLYFLLSAEGKVVRYNENTNTYTTIAELPGFVRGMDQHDDYLFVGLSKIRETSNMFSDLPIAKQQLECGLAIIHIPTEEVVGELYYKNRVQELYDVKIIPNSLFPGLITPENEIHYSSIHTPDGTFWEKNHNKQ